MQRIFERLPGADFIPWLAPLGRSVRLFFATFGPSSFRGWSWSEFRSNCSWMGPQAFHFVTLSAVMVSLALTIQTVIELHKFNAQDISGAAIAIGLLREIGPLTISTAWCVRVACRLSEEVKRHHLQWHNDWKLAGTYVLPRYLAALSMSVPSGAYGLAVGFITGALFAPLIGVSSASDFLESARQAIQDKDLAIYFIKLILVNPTIGVFAGVAAGMAARDDAEPVAANAATATFLGCFVFNLAVTAVMYLHGDSNL